MTKGASIKFSSYAESVPKLLSLLKVPSELVKYDSIVLKPFVRNEGVFSSVSFLESVLKFVLQHKNPAAEVFIAEGVDGADSGELFESIGYVALAGKYGVGLVDLNETGTSKVESDDFERFESVHYPSLLLDACVISLPVLVPDEELGMVGSLANMLGAFPAQKYAGFFSLKKSKIRKWPLKFSVHDVVRCKMPQFAIIDASEFGAILAGLPLDMDKHAAGLLGGDWRSVGHLKLIDELFLPSGENGYKGNNGNGGSNRNVGSNGNSSEDFDL